MDVEKGRSYFQRLLPAHNGSIQESLEDIVGTRFRRSKQLLDVGRRLGASSGFIVYNTQAWHTPRSTTIFMTQAA